MPSHMQKFLNFSDIRFLFVCVSLMAIMVALADSFTVCAIASVMLSSFCCGFLKTSFPCVILHLSSLFYFAL